MRGGSDSFESTRFERWRLEMRKVVSKERKRGHFARERERERAVTATERGRFERDVSRERRYFGIKVVSVRGRFKRGRLERERPV